MSAGIVHDLELVEVEIHQDVAGGLPGTDGPQRFGEPVLEFAAIDQAGQRVVRGLVGEGALQASLVAHVVEDHHGTNEPAAPIADRRRGVLDRDLLRPAVQQQRGLREFHDPSFAQAAQDRALDRLPARLADDVEDLAHRATGGFAHLPASQFLGDRVQVLDGA